MVSLPRWTVVLMCVFMTFKVSKQAGWSQCNPSDEGITVVGGIDGKVVNLTVTCDRNTSHLKFSAGGLQVSSIRLAQECQVMNEHNGSNEQNGSNYKKILSHSTSKQEGCIPNVSPTSSQHLQEFDSRIECHYFGCYLSDPDAGMYIFTFPTATCVFPAQSNTLLKPTTHTPVIFTSIVTYPPEINNSIRQHPGGHGSDQLLLLQTIFAGITVAILLPIPLCLACLLILRRWHTGHAYVA